MYINLIFAILLVSCSDTTELRRLNDINGNLTEYVIDPLYESISPDYNEEKSVIVLKVVSLDKAYEVKATILYKDDFKWYLVDKVDKLLGYTEYKGTLVLVFGEAGEAFYNKTKQVRKFDFLETLDIVSDSKTNTPPIEIEPPIFEPMVWIYSVKGDNYQLIKKGMFVFLE